MPIKNLTQIEQPREKLIKYGPGKLSPEELLAILLRTGRPGLNVLNLSKKILKAYPGTSLSNATVPDLIVIKGLAQAKACEIVACFELGRRMLQGKQSVMVLSPRDVWEELKEIRKSKKEHFVVFFLDTQNQTIRSEVISIGTLNASLIHPREVFEPAVKYLASHIVIAHNHPSGSLQPSQEDIHMTKRLCDAGKILGIEILDHVIVTHTAYSSFKQINLI